MWAVLSDIHGNLEALEAVLVDAEAQGVTAIYCLGDSVGYGPNPVECVERTMGWDVVLMGNFDRFAVTGEDPGFGVNAGKTTLWARAKLLEPRRSRVLAFLADRPGSYAREGLLFVHGSARNPVNEYVFPEDIYNPEKMSRIAACFEWVCFAGHTHVPGVFVEGSGWTYHSPGDFDGVWRLDGRKTIVNVGSVGQPRDGDPRACYVLVDGREVTFRRVEYDIDATVAKVYAIPEFERFLGDRLREGR